MASPCKPRPSLEKGRTKARAVAVSDGRIVWVGTLESMQPRLRRLPHEPDDTFVAGKPEVLQVALSSFLPTVCESIRVAGTLISKKNSTPD